MESPEEAKNTEKTKVEGEEGKAENFFPNSPSAAATDEDKRQWQGFCEIESDPVSSSLISLTHSSHVGFRSHG